MELIVGTVIGVSTLFNIILFLVIVRRLKIELMQTTGERHD